MADDKMSAPPIDRLPIKLILPKQGSERVVHGGGAPPKPFRPVDRSYRERLVTQVNAIRAAVTPIMPRIGSAPVRVKLLTKAAAKSHRPDRLFSRETCPIIGAGQLGEIFVKASASGLERLTYLIDQDRSDRVVKELSCVETIEPVTAPYRRRNLDAIEILKNSPRGETGFITRVRLFDFGPDDDQEKLVDDFLQNCRRLNVEVSSRGYPRTPAQLEVGRITSPGDSVLGVTVGAISHIDYASNGPKQHNPSPYSRHGAGPNHIIKPDLVHYGGACSTDLSHISGVCSVNMAGVADDLGTSFATPLVSRALAQVYHYVTPTPSPVLARALLTHHARDPRTGGRVPDGEENYLGFGVPAPPPYCIECTPNTSTLVFEDTLRPGWYLEWLDFPYPPSLRRDGRYFGEIWMTVAFAPARGARWGTEYCETHIEAHFGVYEEKVDKETGEVSERFKGLVPPEHKNPGALYEQYQVAHLRKWAPVRTYYGNLNPKGHQGTRWRLMVRLLTRHGIEDQEAFKPQPFSLIVTIADPDKKAPVYDQMAQIIQNRFRAENLTLRTAARLRTRS